MEDSLNLLASRRFQNRLANIRHWLSNIEIDECRASAAKRAVNIAQRTSAEVVENDDLIASSDQGINEMTAEKAGPSRHETKQGCLQTRKRDDETAFGRAACRDPRRRRCDSRESSSSRRSDRITRKHTDAMNHVAASMLLQLRLNAARFSAAPPRRSHTKPGEYNPDPTSLPPENEAVPSSDNESARIQ